MVLAMPARTAFRAVFAAAAPSALCAAALIALGCAGTLERGEALYRQGDLRGALELWTSVPPSDRRYAQTQSRLSGVRSELQRSFRLYQKRGEYYEAAGRSAEALLDYRLALKLDPAQRPLMDRVQTLVRELAKRKGEERRQLASALERGDLPAANQHAERLVNLDPFDPAVLLEVRQLRGTFGAELARHSEAGKALYASGAHSQAADEFRNVLALDADNEEALGYLDYIRAIQSPSASLDEALAQNTQAAASGGSGAARPPARSAREAEPEPAPRAISASTRPLTQEDILAAGHFRSASQAELDGDLYWAIQQYEATLRVRPEHGAAQRRLRTLRERLAPQVEALDEAGKRYFAEEDVQNALVMWNRVLLIDPSRERTARNVEDARKILSRLEEIQASD
jgi:tetratricopeptide (TPR) repeat protein